MDPTAVNYDAAATFQGTAGGTKCYYVRTDQTSGTGTGCLNPLARNFGCEERADAPCTGANAPSVTVVVHNPRKCKYMGEAVAGTPAPPSPPPPQAPTGSNLKAKTLASVTTSFQSSGTPDENAAQSVSVLGAIAQTLGITSVADATIEGTVCSISDASDCRGPFPWTPTRRLMAEAMSRRRLSGGVEWTFKIVFQNADTGAAAAAAAQQVIQSTMSTASGIAAVMATTGATITPTSGATAEVGTEIVWVEGSDDNSALAGIIAGSVVGGLVVVGGVGFFLYKKKKQMQTKTVVPA